MLSKIVRMIRSRLNEFNMSLDEKIKQERKLPSRPRMPVPGLNKTLEKKYLTNICFEKLKEETIVNRN